jgi:integrase
MKNIIADYISYRRSLGEKFDTNASSLNSFLKYVGEEHEIAKIDLELCTAFLYAPTGKVTANWFCKYTALKGFFQWALVRGYITKIPLPTDMPKRLPGMQPYIYKNEELKSIFSTALTFQTNRSNIYPESIRMILMLTYFLGLRLHETMSLKIKNIDLNNSSAYICESKFYKSRIVPFNDDVKRLLIKFMKWRKQNGLSDESEIHLFLNKKGIPVNIGTVRGCFQRIRKKAEIIRNGDCTNQPRIHDLRHCFAVNRLTSWYKEGKDVQKLLPVLSTYLGHKHLAHTSVYLTMTDNLLEEANNRFESYVIK